MTTISASLPPIHRPIITGSGAIDPVWYRWFQNWASVYADPALVSGYLVGVGPGFVGREISAASNKIAITNGDGIAGDTTVNVVEANLTHASIGGLTADDHTQYHNTTRANTWLATKSTTDLAEGTNLYFTNERVDDRVAALIVNSGTVTWTYDDGANTLSAAAAGGGSGLTQPQVMAITSIGI